MVGEVSARRWLAVAAAAAVAVHALVFLGLIVDDAYISWRYALNLVDSGELTFNLGRAPVEGYTNFSWVMLSAGFAAVGVRPELVMPLLGLACAMALVVLVVRTGRRLAVEEAVEEDHASRFAGACAALIVALTSGFGMYAVSGLETALYALLLFTASDALVRGRPAPFAALCAAAFLTRPDAALLGVAGVAAFAARRRWRDAGVAVGVFAAILVPYLAWKLWMFGALAPNTLHAKHPSLADGVDYLRQALAPAWGTDWTRNQGMLLLVAAGALGAVWGGRSRRMFTALWLLYALAAVGQGGDWMLAHRFFVPIMPWLALAAEAAWRPRWRVAVGLAVAVFAWSQVAQTARILAFYDHHTGHDQAAVDLARSLRAEGARSVALFDIGLFGYAARDLDIVDLGGLTDARIARAPGGHGRKQLDPAYLAERSPDVVIITSPSPAVIDGRGAVRIRPNFEVERYLLELPWFGASYRYGYAVQATETHFLHVFTRR